MTDTDANFRRARERFEQAAAKLAASAGKIDQEMLDADEMVLITTGDFPLIADREPGETDAEYADSREHWRRIVAGERLASPAAPAANDAET